MRYRLEVRTGKGLNPSWTPTAYVYDTKEEAEQAIERCADLHPYDRYRLAPTQQGV